MLTPDASVIESTLLLPAKLTAAAADGTLLTVTSAASKLLTLVLVNGLEPEVKVA